MHSCSRLVSCPPGTFWAFTTSHRAHPIQPVNYYFNLKDMDYVINARCYESVSLKQSASTLLARARALRADIQHARKRFISRVAHRAAFRADFQHARSVLPADSHIAARFARTFDTPAAWTAFRCVSSLVCGRTVS